MKVRIIQMLCPSRHCVTALAYQTQDGEADPAKMALVWKTVRNAIEEKLLNPWCSICGSRDWKAEDMPTRFSTLVEAMPELRVLEEQSRIARRVLASLRN